jgi:molecular chaperone DnaK
MRKEAEANADADLKRKELIEARNHADNMIYTAEKTLKDFAEKIPADMKTKTEEGVKKVRDVVSSEDSAEIKKATEELGTIIQGLGASFYQQPETAGPTAGSGTESSTGPSTEGTPDGDDVVDGEFKNV